MTVRKKSAPFNGAKSNEAASNKQRSRPAAVSKVRGSHGHGNAHTGAGVSHNGSIHGTTEQKMYFNDPAQVQQWAASSATGFASMEDLVGQDQYYTGFGDAPVMTRTDSFPGSFPMSRSSVAHIPMQQAANGLGAVPGMNYNELCPSGTQVSTGLQTGIHLQQNSSFESNMDTRTGQYHHDAWSYPTPTSDDMVLPNFAATPTTMEGHSNNACFDPSWPQVSCPPGDEILNAGLPCTSKAMTWSPLSAVDPSLSSSYSHNSLIGQEPDTPVSQAIQDGMWSADQDNTRFPNFSVDEPMHFAQSIQYNEQQSDGLSTVKAGRQFQRTPLSNIWPPGEETNQVYMDPKYPGASFQRRASDGEPSTAREHHYYQVGPSADGLYHCPFADSEDCSHKPEKLKCNYDKHLDSHLKPYRCKISTCVELQFSSTACLLRHEREAHGMHGHGEKPHMCTFPECDRSIPGNGFPRRWNLFDHMKRVHDYTGPASSSSSSSSPTPSSTGSYQAPTTLAIRKRRPSSPTQGEPLKRTKSSTGNAQPAPKVTKATTTTTTTTSLSQNKRQSMQKMWLEQKAAIKARLDSLDPNDAGATEQIQADYAILSTIGMNIRRQQASQLASN